MSRRTFTVLFALALMARLYFVFFTIGTSDVVYKTVWAKLAAEHGTARAYARSPYLNEPPLMIAISSALYQSTEAGGAASADPKMSGTAFADLYRLLQVLADIVSAFLLIRIASRAGCTPREIAIAYFASPVAVFISGFHCNADPLLICLVLASIAAISERRGMLILCGALLAAATGIKVVALLLVPLFVVTLRRRSVPFLSGYAAVFGLIFAIPALIAGPAVLRNTFGYSGVGNWWGIVSMMRGAALSGWVSMQSAARAAALYGSILRLGIVLLVALVSYALFRALRNPGEGGETRALLVACGTLFTAIIVFGSGFGVQYLLWPLPFLAFFLGWRSVAVHAAISAFLIVIYTSWSGGFPWNYANSDARGTTTTHVLLGWGVWAILLAVAIAGVRWMMRRRSVLQADDARNP